MRPHPPTTKINYLSWMPTLFVLLWSTGFIGMRLGAPFAEPFTFMTLRMALVVSLLIIVSLAMRAPWPRDWRTVGHLAVAGLLVHATYLAGVLYAIGIGLPLGFVALIAGLQPILTAGFAHQFLHERLRARQWGGMALGLVGVVCVIADKYGLGNANWVALASAAIALGGITAGTLYQKHFCAQMDLRTGGVVQFGATMLALGVLALVFETRQVQWTGQFVFALLWLTLVLSLGAISLLYWMIRRGAASMVASLFFLTPSVTAFMAYACFDERIGLMAIAGLLISGVGVALVMRKN
jgi:drug/metabolite transporter (DMT)-like permease